MEPVMTKYMIEQMQVEKTNEIVALPSMGKRSCKGKI